MMRALFGAPAVTSAVAPAVALAVALSVIAAPTADAALGSVVVNGSVHRDPGGCFDVGASAAQLAVENHTDTVVTVFGWAGCRGEVTAVLNSGQSATIAGTSVLIS